MVNLRLMLDLRCGIISSQCINSPGPRESNATQVSDYASCAKDVTTGQLTSRAMMASSSALLLHSPMARMRLSNSRENVRPVFLAIALAALTAPAPPTATASVNRNTLPSCDKSLSTCLVVRYLGVFPKTQGKTQLMFFASLLYGKRVSHLTNRGSYDTVGLHSMLTGGQRCQ